MSGALIGAAAICWPSFRPHIVSAGIVTLVVIDVLHAVGASQFAHSQTRDPFAAVFFSENFFLIPGWFLGLLGPLLLARKRIDGYYAIFFAASSIAVFGGFLDVLSLSRPLLPNSLSEGFTRSSVALSIGMGLAIAATAVNAIMRDPKRRRLTVIELPTDSDNQLVL